MKQVFDKVVSRFGSINAVVASAGKVHFDSHPSAIINYRTKGICEHYAALEYVKIKTDKSLVLKIALLFSYPTDRLKRLFDTNVYGAFFTAREAANRMIPSGGGSIVLVSSMSGTVRPFLYLFEDDN